MNDLKNLLMQIETPLINSFAKTLGSYEELYIAEVKASLNDFYDNLDILSTNIKDPSDMFCLFIALIISRIKKYIGSNTTLVYNTFLNKNKTTLVESFLLDATQMYYTIPFLLQHLESLSFDEIAKHTNIVNSTNTIDVYVVSIVKTFYRCIGNMELLTCFIKIFTNKKIHNSLRNIDDSISDTYNTKLNVFFTCGDENKIKDFANDSYFTNKKCKIIEYQNIVTDTKTKNIHLDGLKEFDVVLINNATRSAVRSLFYKEIKEQEKTDEQFVTFNCIIFSSGTIPDDKYYVDAETKYFSIPLVGYDCDAVIVD